MTVESGYAEFFGPQVPRTGDEGQTPTFALASAAYRDNEAEEILKANSEWHKSEVGKPRMKLFRPNLGEAFSRAIIDRMLGSGRALLIQSFGTQPQVVVEHALAAHRIRRERDNWLTAVMVLCGLLFLPGLLLWLLVFQIRTTMAKREDKGWRARHRPAGRRGRARRAVPAAHAVHRVLGLVRARGGRGPGARLVLGQADLRAHRPRPAGALGQPAVGQQHRRQGARGGAQQPRRDGGRAAAPVAGPAQRRAAVQLRLLRRPKGILGMGTRWGSWQLAEDLVPADPGREIHPFRSWDVIKAIHDRLRMLERGPLNTGGFPKPSIRHWIVTPIGENATAVTRPEGTDVEAYQVKQHAVQEICNKQQFGAGDRHYLGVQWTLWDGQLVITMLITVTVLHETLRIEVTGHALGPVHSLFTTKPAAKEKEVQKSVKFWETRKIKLPLVDSDEVVRLAARAP